MDFFPKPCVTYIENKYIKKLKGERRRQSLRKGEMRYSSECFSFHLLHLSLVHPTEKMGSLGAFKSVQTKVPKKAGFL